MQNLFQQGIRVSQEPKPTQTDNTETFRPNIILADYKTSAYDYFRNMMNFS